MASAKTGTLAAFGLAGVALGTALTLTLTSLTTQTVNFAPNGTTTGSVIQINGVTEDQIFTTTCTATGGNVKVSNGAKYNTCITASPYTTTGAITQLEISCGNVPTALPGDLSFVKSRASAGSGAAIQNFSNVSLATGAILNFSTGSTLWNPADFVKFNTLTTPGSAVDCRLRIRAYDKYGT